MKSMLTRSKRALAEAMALELAHSRPDFLHFPTHAAYEAACARGEVLDGVKCYVGLDPDLL